MNLKVIWVKGKVQREGEGTDFIPNSRVLKKAFNEDVVSRHDIEQEFLPRYI